ncbi:MAG: hypothetical protein KF802_01945 [Bdellovibrionaceae bacterium]|nr:hypothetical protein [Pseudobdellovibrionaceae bacterium]MBX3033921.1 hypothetical protein [Pseudobdellovibrionaceae bacterium]
MRPGREIDARVAQEIFGHEVWAKNKVLHERTDKGERPLRFYSRDIEFAWEVAEKLRISLVPIEDGQWFAFAGDMKGWPSPQDFLRYLEQGDFSHCGAAVGPSAAAVICEAALVSLGKRRLHVVPEPNPLLEH